MGSVYKRPNSSNWYFSYYDNGKRKYGKGTKDKKTTELLLREAERQARLRGAGLLDEEEEPCDLRLLLKKYLAYVEQTRSEGTFTSIRRCLNHLLNSLNIKTLEELKPNQVEMYMLGRMKEVLNSKTGRTVSARTVNITLGYAKRWLDWAMERELINKNPVKKLKPLKGPKNKVRRALTPGEIKKLLNASVPEKRDIWLAFLLTGLRHLELISLTWGDVDLSGKVLRIRSETVKTKKERCIPIHPELLVLLKKKGVNNSGELVFPNQNGKIHSKHNLMRSFRASLKRAGIHNTNEVDIHALRVTFASRLAQQGVPIATVQKLLGHSSPSITLSIYVKANQTDNKKALLNLSY
jgi:integrase